ncbi:MAG TPA: hypothetical protein VI854_02190, partial [Acidimicrobiia bacterium]|nr:hypothetical protein [Acidimicrobiia bacterium]
SPPPPSPPPVLPLAARPERSPAPAPVDPEADKRCALAQRLADEARREIERAEQGLRDLAEAEHARRSLEWHDARAALR